MYPLANQYHRGRKVTNKQGHLTAELSSMRDIVRSPEPACGNEVQDDRGGKRKHGYEGEDRPRRTRKMAGDLRERFFRDSESVV